MALVAWSDSFLIGVDAVDRQHRHLVDILNRLHEAMQLGGKPHDVSRVLTDLVNYTRYHFSTEESLMRDSNYPGYEEHARKHQAMVAKADEFSGEVMAGKASATLRLMPFLKDWLGKHILETDMRFGEYVNRRAA